MVVILDKELKAEIRKKVNKRIRRFEQKLWKDIIKYITIKEDEN